MKQNINYSIPLQAVTITNISRNTGFRVKTTQEMDYSSQPIYLEIPINPQGRQNHGISGAFCKGCWDPCTSLNNGGDGGQIWTASFSATATQHNSAPVPHTCRFSSSPNTDMQKTNNKSLLLVVLRMHRINTQPLVHIIWDKLAFHKCTYTHRKKKKKQ